MPAGKPPCGSAQRRGSRGERGPARFLTHALIYRRRLRAKRLEDFRPRAGAVTVALTWDEFRKVDIRVGRVLAVDDFPEARNPSYRLAIDFGPLGVKRSSAAIRPGYSKEDLVGRTVVAVVNFPPKQVANFLSEVLVLGAVQSDRRVILLRPDEEGERGARVA